MKNGLKTLLILLLLLLTAFNAFAADTVFLTDTDKNGVLSILKDSGVIDRDGDHDASVPDGGTDCNDDAALDGDKLYTLNGCDAGYYRYCESGVYKTKPGGVTTVANGGQGCTNAAIDEKTNKYFVSGSGSGTACTSGSPCLPGTVATGGSVTPVAPYQIVFTGSTDFTASTGYSFGVAGSSDSVRNLIIKDPRATGKINVTGGSCGTSCASISINANNFIVKGFEVTGGDTTGSGGIRANANNIEIVGNFIHDVTCFYNFNCSGIYGGESLDNIWTHKNIVVDTNDPTRTDQDDVRENIWNIMQLRGTRHKVEANWAGYSHAVNTTPYVLQGGGIRTKHTKATVSCDETDTTRSYYRWNIIANSINPGIQMIDNCVKVYGNLVLNSSRGLAVGPGGDGGTAAWKDTTIYHNTFITGPHVVPLNDGTPLSEIGGAVNIAGDITETTAGAVSLYGNVFNDSGQTTYGGGNSIGMINVDSYGSDARYDKIIVGTGVDHGVGKVLLSNSNCFYNSGIAALTNGFNYYDQSSGGGAGPAGSSVNFANAKLTPYFYEVNSTNGNPTLDNEYRVTTNCPIGTIGWESEWVTAGLLPELGTQNASQRLGRFK